MERKKVNISLDPAVPAGQAMVLSLSLPHD